MPLCEWNMQHVREDYVLEQITGLLLTGHMNTFRWRALTIYCSMWDWLLCTNKWKFVVDRHRLCSRIVHTGRDTIPFCTSAITNSLTRFSLLLAQIVCVCTGCVNRRFGSSSIFAYFVSFVQFTWHQCFSCSLRFDISTVTTENIRKKYAQVFTQPLYSHWRYSNWITKLCERPMCAAYILYFVLFFYFYFDVLILSSNRILYRIQSKGANENWRCVFG